jgi:hypothetical protein
LADGACVVLVKTVFGIGLLLGLGLVWANRQPVIDAYQDDDRAGPDLRLSGVDFDVELASAGPSPYLVADAPDTRAETTGLPLGSSADIGETLAPTVEGGTARLGGVVVGPDGPVIGATVRVERHTRDGVASLDLVTDETGTWEATSILGGRYRIRAWLTGELTMPGSQVMFMVEGSSATVDLEIGPVDPGPHLSFTYRGDLYLGSTGLVAASVTTRAVDDNGIIAVSGVVGGTVTLAPSAGLVALPGVVTTDVDGAAHFTLRCDQVGTGTGVVQFQNRRATFALPTCVTPPPPPTDPPPVDPLSGGDPATPPTVDSSPTTSSPDPTVPQAPTHQVGVVEVIDG